MAPIPPNARTSTAATSPTRRSTSDGPPSGRRSCSPTTKRTRARLSVYVDTARPNAWRQEPYYSQIKRWAAAAAAQRGQVIVWQGRSTIAVLPDRDQDLGEVRPDQFIVTSATQGPQGTMLDVVVVDRHDPAAPGLSARRAAPEAETS